jgi:hypothetical protein
VLSSAAVIVYPRHEVLGAFLEFRRRGAVERDWPGWAALFTEDALYLEHCLGRFHGRQEILDWIGPTMADFPAMTLWIDWWIVDGNRVAFYIWNHLPDPQRAGRWFSFPNGSVIEYAGDGRWSAEEDFYSCADSHRVVGDWIRAGGRRDTPPDEALRSIPDWAPHPTGTPFSRHEVEAQFGSWVERGRQALASGDWLPWSRQYTADARYYDHGQGSCSGREAILEWAAGVVHPSPQASFEVDWLAIEANRVAARIRHRLPDPAGGERSFEFPVMVVLHYAGGGQRSYEEDIYNPAEATAALRAWVAAGGSLPEGTLIDGGPQDEAAGGH